MLDGEQGDDSFEALGAALRLHIEGVLSNALLVHGRVVVQKLASDSPAEAGLDLVRLLLKTIGKGKV